MAALAVAALPSAAEDSDFTFFENQIRPVLSSQCFECHSGTSERLRGGLRLDNRSDFLKGGIDGPIVVPGNPEASLLIKAIRHDHPDIKMPPPKSGRARLPDQVISDFTTWVQSGAPYPEGSATPSAPAASSLPWSLQPLRNPALPSVTNPSWPRQPLDSFILARLETDGLSPEPPADRLTLIRRATFDLTGLPPEPTEIDAFLSDTDPDAFAKVVDRLLASPHYGEHWGRHWLDVVRYADTAGDTADYPVPDAWRYRNYVIDALNADKPYHEFVREQIAGDLMARNGPPEKYAERITATGFLAISRRFGFDSENYHHLTLQDTIDTLGQTFLGLTLGCARCHHHKFDPVSTKDYYGLYGIFASTRFAFPGSEQKNRYRAMVPLVPPAESDPALRGLLSEFAATGSNPQGILRSLDDIDGDFEMQRAASGGSYGVLVPPWLYDGSISVSPEAQSPFRSLHPFGSVGVTLPAAPASVWQSLPTANRHGLLHANLDFRARGSADAKGHYDFSLGTSQGPHALTARISSTTLTLFPDDHPITIALPRQGDWHALRLTIDLDQRAASGSLERPGASIPIALHRLNPAWNGVIGAVAISSRSSSTPPPPTVIDNIACQPQPIPPTTAEPTVPADLRSPASSLEQELTTLVGYDGDLEGQQPDQPPAAPWHPGPNSAVMISTASQSPFHHIHPAGSLGIALPVSPAYNGLGLNLPQPWTTEKAGTLHASFDFHPGKPGSTGDSEGTWRFHIGHGPASPAIELGFHSSAFFVRSGNDYHKAAQLPPDQWHHVQLTLDLTARKFTGTLFSGTAATNFQGDFPANWDGTIDYAFIDSGGHLTGTKPALDADNFTLRTEPLPPPTGTPVAGPSAPEAPLAAKRSRIADLRKQIADAKAASQARQQSLESKLASGPVPLAYAVTDGTPQDARIQLRGEPDRPGDTVPRGFIAVLGQSQLPPQTAGSGRHELAHWITDHNHALTSRVIANRLWQYHFGRPLVRTPNDFGNRSEPPTHPDLLDHLASSLQQSGWSLKSLHRAILLSATWQQATAPAQDGRHADLYAGFPRRRLSAEELRDSILAVSGALDRSKGTAHPFPPATSWAFSQHNPFTAVYDHRQRSVYLMVQRIKRHPFLALFDGADPNASTPDRRPTTVPTQALYFLNDPFVHENSLAAADSLLKSASNDPDRIHMAYRRTLGRPPSPEETSDALAFLAACRASVAAPGDAQPDRPALAAFVRTLFGSNEFLHCD